jgi:DsbC/DsbD-like thiol-disulfide interchange protein
VRLIALLLLLLGLAVAPAAAQPSPSLASGSVAAGPQSTARIEAELVPMSQWATPGGTAIVAIRQQIEPGWHTYWRNPGDSGGATTLTWALPQRRDGPAISSGPCPSVSGLADLMNYGYSGEVFLPVTIEIPADGARRERCCP